MSERVLGLIGTIGAGKTAAAQAFVRHGGTVVDADRVGHEVLESPAVHDKLLARWGRRILHPDGRVNRREVAGIVFEHDAERRALEGMVFPEIGRRCCSLLAAANGPFAVLDAAVMLEAMWPRPAKLVFVDAPREVRLQRVALRGWTDADLAAREAAQWPAEKKKSMSDAVIVNDGSLEHLQAAADRLLAEWGWL